MQFAKNIFFKAQPIIMSSQVIYLILLIISFKISCIDTSIFLVQNYNLHNYKYFKLWTLCFIKYRIAHDILARFSFI